MVDPHPLTESSDDHDAEMLRLDHEAEMMRLYMAAMLFCKCYDVCHEQTRNEPHVPFPPEQQQQEQYVHDLLLGAAEAVRSASAEQQQQYVQAVDVLLGAAEAVRSAGWPSP